jgi:hypothetical protein
VYETATGIPQRFASYSLKGETLIGPLMSEKSNNNGVGCVGLLKSFTLTVVGVDPQLDGCRGRGDVWGVAVGGGSGGVGKLREPKIKIFKFTPKKFFFCSPLAKN